MESDRSSGIVDGGIALDVLVQGNLAISFDRRPIRKAINRGGSEVRKEARRILARRAISSPGDFPGQDSGALRRSIKVYARGSRGGWVKVGPTKTAEMGEFYPAFLYYGSEKTGLAPRANYMEAALKNKRQACRELVYAALPDALQPR